jgi:hypothetical protein
VHRRGARCDVTATQGGEGNTTEIEGLKVTSCIRLSIRSPRAGANVTRTHCAGCVTQGVRLPAGLPAGLEAGAGANTAPPSRLGAGVGWIRLVFRLRLGQSHRRQVVNNARVPKNVEKQALEHHILAGHESDWILGAAARAPRPEPADSFP